MTGWLSRARSAEPTAPAGGMSWKSYFDNLAPVVRAELSRGNRVLHRGQWLAVADAYGRGETEYQLDLHYTLDVTALEAEFELPSTIRIDQGRLIREGASNAVIDGKHEPDEQRRAAVTLWWQQWEAGPRARTRLEPTSTGPATLPTPATAGGPATAEDE